MENQQKAGDGRGLAGMNDGKQRDIAAKGGASVPDEKQGSPKGTTFASEDSRKSAENSQSGG